MPLGRYGIGGKKSKEQSTRSLMECKPYKGKSVAGTSTPPLETTYRISQFDSEQGAANTCRKSRVRNRPGICRLWDKTPAS